MKIISYVALAMLTILGDLTAGSPAGAEAIVTKHRLAQLEWKQALMLAKTPEQKAEIYQQQPDAQKFSLEMEQELVGSLNADWAMPYAIWLLENHPAMTMPKLKHVLGVIQKAHLQSPAAGVFAIRLVGVGAGDPDTQVGLTAIKTSFIDDLQRKASSKVVQGQAALAKSMLLGQMGDGANLNGKRLQLLRKAIIDAADAQVGDVTVAKLVEEELYRMNKLSVGVKAPDLQGVDAAGGAISLSQYKGKVVILVFWSSWESADQTSQFLMRLKQNFAGKPLELVGVNRDSLQNLREIEKRELMPGHHFSDPAGLLFHAYRVELAPWCFVIDDKGVIQYEGGLGSFAELTASALLNPEKETK